MRTASCLIAAAVLVGLLAGSSVRADEAADGADPRLAAAGETTKLALKYRPSRSWRYELPAETWHKVGGGLDFSAVGGARFATQVEGGTLRIDTDGDGSPDVDVEGEAGYVRLRTAEGFDYSIRLRNQGGWHWSASGARVGKIGDVRIVLIDQDGDGRYDGYGRDAMIVGTSRVASFLSRVANVGGRLHTLRVAPDGRSLGHVAYTGAKGTLDVARRWKAQARLRSAILRSEDGTLAFDLAGHVDGMAVPAGRYVLHGGSLALGDSVVRFRRGNAEAVEVTAETTTRVLAGGPLKAEFAFQRRGDEIVLQPEALRWYGRAGEEYYAWSPFGKSPEFTITDRDAKKEVAKAIFTGC